MPFISIVVPAHDEEACIGNLLSALEVQTYPRECFEIIVVDDMSSDATRSIAMSYPRVQLIARTTKTNQWACMNAGIRAAKGEYIASTDADCIPGPEWLVNGMAAMQNKRSDLCAGGITFTFPVHSAATIYDSITFLQQEYLVKHRHVACTANLFYYKAVWNAVGNFDEYDGSNPDFAFTAEAIAKGFSLIYASNAHITHPARKAKDSLKKAFVIGLGKGGALRNTKKNCPKIQGASLPLAILYLNPLLLIRRLTVSHADIGAMLTMRIIAFAYVSIIACVVGFLRAFVRSTKLL